MARATWLAGLLALALSACAEPRSAHTNGSGGGVIPPDSLDRVLSRTFTVPAFKLESGVVLPELTLAYETYGRLAPDGKLVGRAHRLGQGARHRPLFRRVVQHARLLVRLDRAREPKSKDRQAIRPRLPGHHLA